MSNLEINKVLAQMRSMSTEMQPQNTTPVDGENSFGEVMMDAVKGVSDRQMAASDMGVAFQQGTTDASVAEVMVAMQKASLSFQAMTEVRNKLVDAYQEIMNMPI